MAMVVPRTKQDPKRPSPPDIPIQYLAMAAATMAQQGKLNPQDQQPASDGPASS